jgi:hypothetical protein
MKVELAWLGFMGGNQQGRALLLPLTLIFASNQARTTEYGEQHAFHAIKMVTKRSSVDE